MVIKYPRIPKRGMRRETISTESAASATLMPMEKTCCPSPFSIASVAVSTYMIGINGASRRMYLAASVPG